MATQMQALERVFLALADGTRLRILGLLSTGEVCVCDIQAGLDISQPKASRHLAYLRRAGLVDARRDGLWVHYRLADLPDPALAAVLASVREALGRIETVQRDTRTLRKTTGCAPANPPTKGRR